MYAFQVCVLLNFVISCLVVGTVAFAPLFVISCVIVEKGNGVEFHWGFYVLVY